MMSLPMWCLLAGAIGAAGAGDGLQVVDMYRGMATPHGGEKAFKVTNNNLADVIGVLRYIHQEVIVEHALNKDRPNRKSDIDAIVHYRMKVRNPDTVAKNRETNPFGFGSFSAFDFGVATEPVTLSRISELGDFVGAQTQSMISAPVLNLSYPWYWFSVTGQCPNLPWECIKGSSHADCTSTLAEDMGVVPAPCLEVGCAGKFDKAASECVADVEDESTWGDCCLRYGPSVGGGSEKEIIKGGLCSSDEDPTGTPGCTYNYDQLSAQSYVKLDELVGIKSMECGDKGERSCENWLDWRKNCFDPEKKYKKMFQCQDCFPGGSWNVEIVDTSDCVEYDLHPFCQDSSPENCKDPRCLALTDEEKELGLPFWKGRCDATANQRRGEKIAGRALAQVSRGRFLANAQEAVIKTHKLVDEDLILSNPSCSNGIACSPNPNGGPYCTRQFGGVCTPCYIPGTLQEFHDSEALPTCPFSILKEHGVAHEQTKCASTDPEDLCCLYNISGTSCTGREEIGMKGYLAAMALTNAASMEAFAQRWIKHMGGQVDDQKSFQEEVYWLWHIHPPKEPKAAWEKFQTVLQNSNAVDWSGKTDTTTTPPSPSPPPSPAPAAGGDAGTGGMVAMVIGVTIAISICCFLHRRQQMIHREARRASSVEEVSLPGARM